STPDSEASSTPWLVTGLTGRFLKRSQVSFNQNSISPSISIEFNDEGAKLFAEITKVSVGKRVAILLDGQVISAPVVQEEIRDGRAEISGQFTVEEAKTLVRDLNLGALPVPVSLASTEVVGASLGSEATKKGVEAGLIGLFIVAVFMILWYRLPGLVSVISLSIYVMIMLAIFKLIPVTLTAAGIAGFILSIGIAVDANVLIFERLREELKKGKGLHEAIREGFSRAWSSIRDSNMSSIISAAILFWFGTSLIKGFALTFALGVVVSMFTAITITRILLLALNFRGRAGLVNFLFGSAFFKN
ncbi:MAG TPA: protein translocase subunit SecD, partial [Candidatus Paceibacterota bacterium]|nr:protein translocase subunit SecD [Candidatus Paceibacterota bacterium]